MALNRFISGGYSDAIGSMIALLATATTELTDSRYRGTVLIFQAGLGFALRAVNIKLVPVLESGCGWGIAFAVLGTSPLIGIVTMLRLRQLPEGLNLVNGRR